MTLRPRALPLLFTLALGCGPSTLQLSATTRASLRTGPEAAFEIQTLTDLDDVRDVALSGSRVYVATDRGLLVYPSEAMDDEGARPERLTRAGGLPSDDLRAVEADTSGRVTVATATGLVEVDGAAVVNPILAAPPVGEIADLWASDEGTLWACGREGLARRVSGGWERVGEPLTCTVLAGTPEGHLWVGTTRGLLYVEGDVIREHQEGRGLPARHVLDVLSLGAGEAFALLLGPTEASLAHWDGHRWFSYVAPGLEEPVVGLGLRGTDVVLVSEGHALALAPAGEAEGVALVPVSSSERFAPLSYRARLTPAAEVTAPAELPDDGAREPLRLGPLPAAGASVDAPGWVARPVARTGEGVYRVRRSGGRLYLGDRNRGVVEVGETGVRHLRARDLVDEDDLAVVGNVRGDAWVVTRDGQLAIYRDGALRRVATPEGTVPQAVATGPDGVYVSVTVPATENLLRVYQIDRDGFRPFLERTLTLPSPLAAAPLLGVGADGFVWACIRVRRDAGSVPRGCVQMATQGEAVTYHHGAAERGEVDGQEATRMPDLVSTIDVNETGMAWFSSISGAIRLGQQQAIYFGEARGVRGEVVSDVLVGERGRVWIAAAEGVGYYQNREFEFRLPQLVQRARPSRLALGRDGVVWAAGPNGLLRHEGETWTAYGEVDGLPVTDLRDVETDPSGRLWLLGADRVLVLSRR